MKELELKTVKFKAGFTFYDRTKFAVFVAVVVLITRSTDRRDAVSRALAVD